ncbi:MULTISPECIES: hypothetical protein [unclassified Lactobacillus]|uniref:hypothetical protein n=1 Tax=unclassified Lactobacillus TaxID=2620435 RepID=UPI00226A98EE|nr:MULTISPECIES: hypothetical protein [unclassified Lactobacillus]MCX8720505.1 hypothetical protein [Lactobacillus sp. B4010]MCX8731472.1 hypothetical protein [Lactobacillus sp. B4015]MCX8733693.1 hypothetical protein [Lactobacillus sp. B4012]
MDKKEVTGMRIIMAIIFTLTTTLLVFVLNSATIVMAAQVSDSNFSELAPHEHELGQAKPDLQTSQKKDTINHLLAQQTKYQKQLKKVRHKITALKANLERVKTETNDADKKKRAEQIASLQKKLRTTNKQFKRIYHQLHLLQKQISNTNQIKQAAANSSQDLLDGYSAANTGKQAETNIPHPAQESQPYQQGFAANQKATNDSSPLRAVNLSPATSKTIQAPNSQSNAPKNTNDLANPSEQIQSEKANSDSNNKNNDIDGQNAKLRKAPIQSMTTIRENEQHFEPTTNKQYTLTYGNRLPQTDTNLIEKTKLTTIGLIFLSISLILSGIANFKKLKFRY